MPEPDPNAPMASITLKVLAVNTGMVRVDDPGVIQCAIQVAIHETGSRPQNRGKGGSRII